MKARHSCTVTLIAMILLSGPFAQPTLAKVWWNPFTWLEEPPAIRLEKDRYRIERAEYVQTLEEANGTGDAETIRQAKAELREFDQTHARRIRMIRKLTRVDSESRGKANSRTARFKINLPSASAGVRAMHEGETLSWRDGAARRRVNQFYKEA